MNAQPEPRWPRPVRWADLDDEGRQDVLRRPSLDAGDRASQVRGILAEVRQRGDEALAEFTQRFDGYRVGTGALPIEVDADDVAAAEDQVRSEVLDAIDRAAARIEAFHAADRPRDRALDTAPGLTCRVRYLPLSPVGLYVPGGSAPLVSTVLMLAIPARIAGCADTVLCTPSNASGHVAPEVLAAAHRCGVDRVFRIGGAQAIAAMAYGTESIPRCAKLFGPGNAWVTEAKQQVAADPAGAAIDLPAGPSEVLVIADERADPEWIALDLLSQAEHGPDSQVVLLSDSANLASAVCDELRRQAGELPRAAIITEARAAARLVVVDSLDQALDVSETYAPEHLLINTQNALELAERVTRAGSVFIGPWTPESLGDYCSGTNHVLPTYGFARSHGALGVADFMRRMTLQAATPEGLQAAGPQAEVLAAVEGLDAHRLAVTARLERLR